LRSREDNNISGNNTTVSSIKVAGFNSQLNIKTQGLNTAHTKGFGKNFQGIEEIPDENSQAKHENMASPSNGHWSSDCADESLTLNISHLVEQTMPQPLTSAFTEQFKK
jgi:hypothetical protein